MNRSTGEIRQLQAKVYGRQAAASQVDVDRLAELTARQRSERVEDVSAVELLSNTSEEDASTFDTSDVGVSNVRSRYVSRPIVVGAFLLTFVGGIAGGLAIASVSSPASVRAIMPPDAEIYRSDSIVFYGEIDGVNVWTGNLVEDDRECLIAMRESSGGTSCADGASPLAVDLPDSAGRVTMDLSNPQARPVVDLPRT